MKKNDELTLKCIDITYDGYGICKIDDFILYVKDLIVDEEAIVKVISVKKHYGFGKIIKLLVTSEYRINPKCSINNKCGGCQYGHIAPVFQKQMKYNRVKDCFNKISKMNPLINDVLVMDEPFRYRNKVQIPLKVVDGKVQMGFYRNHSNDIVEFDDCLVQSVLSNQIAHELKELIEQSEYKTLFRHILIKHAIINNEVMIVFIVRDNKIDLSKIVDKITIRHQEIKSIILNINKRNDNVILGDEEVLLYGSKYIQETLNGLKFNISSKSFYQINPYQTSVLYNKVVDYCGLKGNEVCVDLYCGTGTIGIFLARYAKKVYGIEIVKEAIEDAKRNAVLNHIDNIEFKCGDAGIVAQELIGDEKIDVVVVDPPRKGLDQNAINTVLKLNPDRLVYVSCDPATLARDIKILNEYYDLLEVQPVDLFPGTFHVENVCLLSKRES